MNDHDEDRPKDVGDDDFLPEFDVHTTTAPAADGTRRRRLVAGVGAAMLVAAAGGVGFGIGRAVDDGGTAAGVTVDEPPLDTDADIGTPPEEEAPASFDDAAGEPHAEISDAVGDAPAETMLAAEDEAASAPDVAAPVTGGGGWSMFGGAEMTFLAERVTDAGVVVRAHRGPSWDDDGYYEDEYIGDPGAAVRWEPPGWCSPDADVRIALATSGPGVIDVGQVSWWDEPFEGRAVSWLSLGHTDGDPHRLVVVQAPGSTGSVTATFGDGASDTAAVDNGVALLVVPGAPELIVHDEGDYSWTEERVDVTVTFDDASEPVVIEGNQGVGNWDDPDFRASCQPPPPALPEPGEQPADPAAAEEAIRAVMDVLYGDDGDETIDGLTLIDDPTGVAEAREQVREGSFEEAAAAAEAIIEELVFTTPTDAWFRYRIETTTGIFDRRFGQAVEVDGVWKVTRATVCQDLGLAGGSCGDDWFDVQPPSVTGG